MSFLNFFIGLFIKKKGPLHLALGKRGEKIACRYLKRRGYTILEKNYETKYGEIDLIALEDDVIVFVEVKARTGDEFGEPEHAVNRKKRAKIKASAKLYIEKKRLHGKNARFDIVSIKLLRPKGKKEICLFRDAFRI